MYHFRILFLSICFFSINLNAQTDYGETLKSRLYVGGTFELRIGTISYVDLSPMVGYNINRYLSGGVGMTYIFYSERNGSESIRDNFFGGRIFTRILPLPDLLPGIFLHGELESINNERYIKKYPSAIPELARAWTPAVLVGAGFRQQAGTNSYFTVSVLYNTLDEGTPESTIYGGPLIYRVGFIFGLY